VRAMTSTTFMVGPRASGRRATSFELGRVVVADSVAAADAALDGNAVEAQRDAIDLEQRRAAGDAEMLGVGLVRGDGAQLLLGLDDGDAEFLLIEDVELVGELDAERYGEVREDRRRQSDALENGSAAVERPNAQQRPQPRARRQVQEPRLV